MFQLLFFGPMRLIVMGLIALVTLALIRPRLALFASLGLFFIGVVVTPPELRSGALAIIKSFLDEAPRNDDDANIAKVRIGDQERVELSREEMVPKQSFSPPSDAVTVALTKALQALERVEGNHMNKRIESMR